jgi:hypothetical protein
MTPFFRTTTAVACFFFLAACSETPQPTKKEAEKPDEPLTGRQAFQRMYPQARVWAADALPLQLTSYNLPQIKSAAGKAGAWQAIFVSAQRGKSRSYSWSAVEGEGSLHKGVYANLEETWSGSSGQNTPFQIEAIKVDSDEAYETAMKDPEVAAFAAKSPDKPMTYILELSRRFPDVTWRVLWGESIGTADYTVFVDGSTGKLLSKVH